MTWVLVFIVMLVFVLTMAIGVIMGRKPIAGSCGGIANLGIEKECSICGGSREKCEEMSTEAGKNDRADLAYDASRP